MLKRNIMIQENRCKIRNFGMSVDKLIERTKYLPLESRNEAERALTDLHDFILFIDPTREDVESEVDKVCPAIGILKIELEHLIDIQSDSAESLISIVRNYTQA